MVEERAGPKTVTFSFLILMYSRFFFFMKKVLVYVTDYFDFCFNDSIKEKYISLQSERVDQVLVS